MVYSSGSFGHFLAGNRQQAQTFSGHESGGVIRMAAHLFRRAGRVTHLFIPLRKLRKLAPSISFPSEFTSCG